MSAWSVQRQIAYFIVALAFFAGVGGALFWLTRPDPSCADGRRNQDETGIDCGGACRAVCKNEIRPLKVIWSRVLKVSADNYDSITLIENPNAALGVRRLPYTIKFYDADNLLVVTREGQTFVMPQESFVVYEKLTFNDFRARAPVRARFELADEDLNWERINAERPDLDFSSQVFTPGDQPSFRATLTNRSLNDLGKIEVKVVLFDAEENAVGGSATEIESLPRGASRDIVFTWPSAFAAPPLLQLLYPHFDFSVTP